MIQKQVLALCLKNNFWKEARYVLNEQMFPKELSTIYLTMTSAHEKYESDLSVKELLEIHRDKYPALPTLTRNTIEEVILSLSDIDIPKDEIAKDLLLNLWRRNKAREIGEKSIEIFTGKKDANFQELQKIVVDALEIDKLDNSQTYTNVVQDLDEMLNSKEEEFEFKFGLPSLERRVEGLSRGNFGILLARPEVGKTTFACFLASQYLQQGKKVVYWANEEPAVRIKLRIVQSLLGKTKDEIKKTLPKCKEEYEKIKDLLVVHDCVGTYVSEIQDYATTFKPDVMFLDQLDKVKITGEYNRTDEKLKEVYVQTREICKRAKCLIWAVSQASYEAEGREKVDYSMLDNSRTGKAGEADIIIGIGMDDSDACAGGKRKFYISKNKINGDHSSFDCIMNHRRGVFDDYDGS